MVEVLVLPGIHQGVPSARRNPMEATTRRGITNG